MEYSFGNFEVSEPRTREACEAAMAEKCEQWSSNVEGSIPAYCIVSTDSTPPDGTQPPDTGTPPPPPPGAGSPPPAETKKRPPASDLIIYYSGRAMPIEDGRDTVLLTRDAR